MPDPSERNVELGASNPFIDSDDDPLLHPMLQHESASVRDDSVVNAFIKVQWLKVQAPPRVELLSKIPLRKLARPGSGILPEEGRSHQPFVEPAMQLPPQFGDVKLADALDRRLYDFCKSKSRF